MKTADDLLAQIVSDQRRIPPQCLDPAQYVYRSHRLAQGEIMISTWPPVDERESPSGLLGPMVELNVVERRPVPAPVLLHHPLLKPVEPCAVVVPGIDGAVKGVVQGAGVHTLGRAEQGVGSGHKPRCSN